jgi:hypothetical protein
MRLQLNASPCQQVAEFDRARRVGSPAGPYYAHNPDIAGFVSHPETPVNRAIREESDHEIHLRASQPSPDRASRMCQSDTVVSTPQRFAISPGDVVEPQRRREPPHPAASISRMSGRCSRPQNNSPSTTKVGTPKTPCCSAAREMRITSPGPSPAR